MFVARELEEFPKVQVLIPYILGHMGFIAGGCFKNILNGEKVKDIDIFFEKESDFHKANLIYKEDKNYKPYYSNNKVEAYKNENTGIVVELIKWKFGTPEKIIGDFDFTITKFALYNEPDEEGFTTKIIHHENFFEHLFFKRLVIDDKCIFPESTFERVIKYSKYGYYPCRETKIKLIQAIRESTSTEGISKSLYDGVD